MQPNHFETNSTTPISRVRFGSSKTYLTLCRSFLSIPNILLNFRIFSLFTNSPPLQTRQFQSHYNGKWINFSTEIFSLLLSLVVLQDVPRVLNRVTLFIERIITLKRVYDTHSKCNDLPNFILHLFGPPSLSKSFTARITHDSGFYSLLTRTECHE